MPVYMEWIFGVYSELGELCQDRLLWDEQSEMVRCAFSALV